MLSTRKYTAMAVLGVGLAIAASVPASARYYGYGYHRPYYGHGYYHRHYYHYGFHHRPYYRYSYGGY